MKINIQNTRLRISAGLPSQFPGDPVPQIAFAGRSNVGKSSLINTLLGRKSLARVSGEPGKTITINFYDIDGKLFLVDLPGYGYAKHPPQDKEKWSRLTDGYFTDNKNIDRLMLSVLLIDSRVGATKDDRDMLTFLNESEMPYVIAATKSDKLNATERAAFIASVKTDADFASAEAVIMFSSKTAEGKKELWDEIIAHCG